jgi:RNA polymerase sigma factor (sigma-70 family)
MNSEDEDVQALIRKAQAQEKQWDEDGAWETYQEAGEIIFPRYLPSIKRLVSASLSANIKHLTEDIAQEVCLEVYKSLPGFDENRGPLKIWIFTILYRCQKTALTRYWRHSRPYSIDGDGDRDNQMSLTAWTGDRFELYELIAKRMNQLSDENRIIMAMCMIGMTSPEIAEITRLSEASVRKRIQRAKEILNGEKSGQKKTSLNHRNQPVSMKEILKIVAGQIDGSTLQKRVEDIFLKRL